MLPYANIIYFLNTIYSLGRTGVSFIVLMISSSALLTSAAERH